MSAPLPLYCKLPRPLQPLFSRGQIRWRAGGISLPVARSNRGTHVPRSRALFRLDGEDGFERRIARRQAFLGLRQEPFRRPVEVAQLIEDRLALLLTFLDLILFIEGQRRLVSLPLHGPSRLFAG